MRSFNYAAQKRSCKDEDSAVNLCYLSNKARDTSNNSSRPGTLFYNVASCGHELDELCVDQDSQGVPVLKRASRG